MGDVGDDDDVCHSFFVQFVSVPSEPEEFLRRQLVAIDGSIADKIQYIQHVFNQYYYYVCIKDGQRVTDELLRQLKENNGTTIKSVGRDSYLVTC